MTASQKAVLDVLKEHGPLPDAALVPITQHFHNEAMSSSSIRSRRAELARMPRSPIKAVGSVKMPSGRSAIVWGVK